MDREILYPNFKEFLRLFYKKYDPYHGPNHTVIFLGSHRGMEDFYLDLSSNEWHTSIHRVDGMNFSQAGRGNNFVVEYRRYTMLLDDIKKDMNANTKFNELSSWPIAAIEADKFLVLK